jgi:hypothetical protein
MHDALQRGLSAHVLVASLPSPGSPLSLAATPARSTATAAVKPCSLVLPPTDPISPDERRSDRKHLSRYYGMLRVLPLPD